MRSGTVPHTLVVGMGEACEIAMKEMDVSEISNPFILYVQLSISTLPLSIYTLKLLLSLSLSISTLKLLPSLPQYDSAIISRLSCRLVDGITSQLEHVVRNGDPKETYDGSSIFDSTVLSWLP